MSTAISDEQADLFANSIFLNAVLPLLRTIVEARPKFQQHWRGRSAVCQVSCFTNAGRAEKNGTHFRFSDGVCTPERGLYTEGKPDFELEFSSVRHLNNFFKGVTFPLPRLKGAVRNFPVMLRFMSLLLCMAGLLGSKKAPAAEEDQVLLVRCMFTLLPRGISILNKLGHPDLRAWTGSSPDRVYAWAVQGYPELAAYLRIKKGNSKAGKGQYTRSMPFFTMQFDSPLSALGILQETDDMIEATIQKRLVMVGGPEFGAQLGDFMLLVGSYIK